MPQQLAILRLGAGYETPGPTGVHHNGEICRLLYEEVLVARWGLPPLSVIVAYSTTGKLSRLFQQHDQNAWRFWRAQMLDQSHSAGSYTVCSLEIGRPSVRLDLTFSRDASDERDEPLLATVQITTKVDVPLDLEEITVRLVEDIKALARKYSVQLYAEEEQGPAALMVETYEQRSCYRSWHDPAAQPGEELTTPSILPVVGMRVQTKMVIERYPLMYFDLVGGSGTVTRSNDTEVWIKMDLVVLGLGTEWDNQLVLVSDALSGEGNNGVEIATMADLFWLYFEPCFDSGDSEQEGV
jgi:hypothetical protein